MSFFSLGDLDLIEPGLSFPKDPIALSRNKKPNNNISSDLSIEDYELANNDAGKFSLYNIRMLLVRPILL